ncbi:ribonuclease 3 [Calliphora vicina]|uniref:ribonuclease 3 n=1 Tax=Calliphora vicina TaxID=7373 RepID=UPI00325B3DE7
MSYPPPKKDYDSVPNYYYYPPPQVATTTPTYAAPPIPGVSSTPSSKAESAASPPPLPPGSENLYNYVCTLPPPPPPPPPGNENVSVKQQAYKHPAYLTDSAAVAHSGDTNKLEKSSAYSSKYAGGYSSSSSYKPSGSEPKMHVDYHRPSSNYSYPPPAASTSRYATTNASYDYQSGYQYEYDSNYYSQNHHGSSHSHRYPPSTRPRDGEYYARPSSSYASYSKSDQYYDNKTSTSSSHSDSGRSDKNYVGKRHRQRDERPAKSESERDRLLRNWRSNYCETSEEIQRKMDELAEMDDESREVWVRSSPADPYYKRTNNVHEVEATLRLEMLCELFEEKLIKRSEAIRESLPTYKPPPRQTRRRVCKHKSEGCTSSDSDSSDNEEFKMEQDNCMEELSRKLQHPCRVHADLWHNENGEMNDGPLCRCSVKSRRVGIRHGIYPGEDGYPKCDVNSNNAHKLHHYRITISPPTNFLTKTPTIIKHDEHEFLFEGFSLLSHFPLMDLPTCKVIRFNIEYTILYVPEKMPENFTVRELDLFSKYLFHELLELVDFSLLPNIDGTIAANSCPAFHFLPRFVRDLPDNGKEVLAMCEVLKYLLDNAGPLVDIPRLHNLNHIPQTEWQDYVDNFKGMLATKPGYKPSSVRVDQLDRNVSDLPECYDAESDVSYPAIVHFGIRPPQLSYAGNPEYQKAWREYVKFRHLMANMSKPSFKDKRKLEEKEARLQEMRTQGRMKRNVTVAVSSKGYHRTGVMCDIVQHAMLVPVLTGHLRFHRSLDLMENNIGYKFKNRYLLQLALTHPSYKENYGTNPDHARNSLTNCGIRQPEYGDRKIHYMNTRKRGINTLINIMSRFGKEYETMSNITHNERLEFLGDAVVEFLSSIHLFFMFPELEEGGLATYRAAIVQNQHLALLAKKLHLEEYMLYAHGSDLCHELELRHAMANCFEALMGALLLDGGISVADEVFMDALFMENELLREIWKNLPEHPLQEQEPLGDRDCISSYPMLQELTKFEDSIGIEFKHIRLLARAFTDRSIGFTHLTLGSNQRLEFLGDTVLQLICSEYLYRHFPEHHEGHLSLLRSSLVNNRTQAVVCDDLGMTKYAVYSNPKAELKTKDRADLLEAFLGSLYVDKGLLYCEQFCHVCLFPRLQLFIMNQDWNDPKSKLQQCCLTLRTMDGGEPDIPLYKVIESSGPTNTRVYTVAVYFRNKRLATATGSSIQQAEMNAAKQALENSRDLFPQLDHQKRVIAKSIKKQTGRELNTEESTQKDERKPKFAAPMEDESHLPKQYREREDISSDELPEDDGDDEGDEVENDDVVKNMERRDKRKMSAYSSDKFSDTESLNSVASVDTPKKKSSRRYSDHVSPKRVRLQHSSPEVIHKSIAIIPPITCEDVSSDDEDFQRPSEPSKQTAITEDKTNKQNLILNDLKDLVEDISSSSDLEPGEISN